MKHIEAENNLFFQKFSEGDVVLVLLFVCSFSIPLDYLQQKLTLFFTSW